MIWHFPSLILVSAWFFSYQETPLSCISKSQDLVSLTQCLDEFTILPDYYDAETYEDAQPTEDQRQAWKFLVSSLLWVDGNCSSVAVPSSLENIYSIRPFAPTRSQRDYCVLLENSVDFNGFPKGWGHVIVPATRAAVSRALHLSAPHPKYDLGTIEQATALFEFSGAKSLLLAGRTRTAFSQPSKCIVRSPTLEPFYQTDPVHNKVDHYSVLVWVT